MPESVGYPDLHEHLQKLDDAGLLTTIDEPVNKDTHLHPLVRWQFRGGIPEEQRKAFKFTNVTDSLGRSYEMPVVVGALSTNAKMYSIGMGVPVEEIGNKLSRNRIEHAQIIHADDINRYVELGVIPSMQHYIRKSKYINLCFCSSNIIPFFFSSFLLEI